MMKKYKVMVWHDYKATDTYSVIVKAESEEQAMERAVEAVTQGEGKLSEWAERDRCDDHYEANENSVEKIQDI